MSMKLTESMNPRLEMLVKVHSLLLTHRVAINTYGLLPATLDGRAFEFATPSYPPFLPCCKSCTRTCNQLIFHGG